MDQEDGMNDLAARKAEATPRAGVARSVALWVLQVVLAFQFAGGGLLKLTGAPAMVDLFADVGAGQWLRFVVGALEVAGAVGLLIPRLSGLAALGLAGLLVGATATNLLVIDQSPWLAIALLLASLLVAWGRWPRTADLLARRG
jgi:uncharacterized membrane protein YphA (DoxX/SURF4 family)